MDLPYEKVVYDLENKSENVKRLEKWRYKIGKKGDNIMECNTVCRLCKNNVKLVDSHIIPKLFYNKLKKDSFTGYLRDSDNPNIRRQDGEKVKFLCEECEKKFNYFETWFSNSIYNDVYNNKGLISFDAKDKEINYFILSVCWRVLQLLKEKGIKELNPDEYEIIDQKLETWRNALLNQDFKIINDQNQFVIPTAKLSYFKNDPLRVKNNILNDFHFYSDGNKRTAYVFVQVPYLILLTEVFGDKKCLKANKIGRTIMPRDTRLPDSIIWQLDRLHKEEAAKMVSKMNDTQKKMLKDLYKNYLNQQRAQNECSE